MNSTHRYIREGIGVLVVDICIHSGMGGIRRESTGDFKGAMGKRAFSEEVELVCVDGKMGGQLHVILLVGGPVLIWPPEGELIRAL